MPVDTICTYMKTTYYRHATNDFLSRGYSNTCNNLSIYIVQLSIMNYLEKYSQSLCFHKTIHKTEE